MATVTPYASAAERACRRPQARCACSSAAWTSPRRSCCSRAASASARSTRASRASPTATPAPSCSRARRHSRGSAIRRTGCSRRPPACSTPSACRTRASITVVRNILPQLDFSETRFIANVCGSTIEEYVEVTRRFDALADRRHRDQHLLSERQGRRRRLRQLSRHVGTGGGGLPARHAQAAHHQAVAQPDRHPRERAPLHRGGHRCARGDQHRHGHGDRRRRRAAR